MLIFLIAATVNALRGWISNKEFSPLDRRLSLGALVVSHVQLLIGLFTFYLSPLFDSLRSIGMGAAMKNAALRKALIEHPSTMLVAIVLLTIGFSKHKKKTNDLAKFKTLSWYYGMALLLSLAMIPWAQWLAE